MSTICLEKMIIEEDKELAPKIKKMKLTSESSQSYEINRENLFNTNTFSELNRAFPYLNEEKIKEILHKSEENVSIATNMIHDINLHESKNNKDFVNLHQQNRKRRFDEINNSNISTPNEISNGIMQNINEKRKFIVPSKRSQESNLSEEDLDKLITGLDRFKNRKEMVDYLKYSISNIINKSSKSKIESSIPDKNIEENKKENLHLKKIIVSLYKKNEVFQNENKKLQEENIKLRSQIEKLDTEVIQQRAKNNSMAMILRHVENSNRFDQFDPEDIY